MDRFMKLLIKVAGFVCLLSLVSGAVRAEWGTIKGRIVWGGDKVPVAEDLTPIIKKNADATFCLKDGKVLSEAWVIDAKDKGIRWTFVWLAPDPANPGPLPVHPKLKGLDKKDVVIDQPICMYLPHALALRQGQTLV